LGDSYGYQYIGIDLAENTYQLHGVEGTGRAILKKRLSLDKLAAYIAGLASCLIVMEACGGANYWVRVFQRCGHLGADKLNSNQRQLPNE